MNNRELYKKTFSHIHASTDMTMEDIMNIRRKPVRANRRLVTVCAMIVIILAMGVTANAASGGAISTYFDRMLGVDQKMQLTSDGDDPITIYMSDLKKGIYDEDQNLIEDLNNKNARDIVFDEDTQTCKIDGKTYHVILLINVDEGVIRNKAHGQLRLYAPEDYEKAMDTLEAPPGTWMPRINH